MNEPSLSSLPSLRIDMDEIKTLKDPIRDQAESMMVGVPLKTNLVATTKIWSSCRIWFHEATIEKEA